MIQYNVPSASIANSTSTDDEKKMSREKGKSAAGLFFVCTYIVM